MEQNQTDQIITELKQLKMQGFSYTQAAARLKETGYTDAQLAAAEEQFNYDTPVAYDKNGNPIEGTRKMPKLPPVPAKPELSHEPGKPPQKPVSSTQENYKHPARPYLSVAFVIAVGILGAFIYRSWVNLHLGHFGYDPKYLKYNNALYYLLSAAVGMVVAYIALVVFFFVKDKKHK